MKLEDVNPFELVPNPWNSNKVDRDNFEKLKQSVSALGSFKPVIVREKDGALQILGGYHRTEAAKELGLSTIPVLNLGPLSEQRAKEISLVDNTRYGADDEELLSKLLDSMDTELISMVIPEVEELDLPEIDDTFGEAEERVLSNNDDDDGTKVLKFRYRDLDKADEVEDALMKIAREQDYAFGDGFPDLAEALYYALVVERK